MEKMFQGIDSLISIELDAKEQNVFISSMNEAFDELKSAVLNLKQYITDNGIKEFVEEILSEENTSKEES